jgi:Xaa-Pro aminopeptidase
MVLAIEPGIYWPGGGGLRLEDDFLITDSGNEKMCTDPDDFRLAKVTPASVKRVASG